MHAVGSTTAAGHQTLERQILSPDEQRFAGLLHHAAHLGDGLVPFRPVHRLHRQQAVGRLHVLAMAGTDWIVGIDRS
jgi:hypothetical protein